MAQIIDHKASKIYLALGLKEEYATEIKKIVHDQFCKHTPEGGRERGHEKASISLVEVINLARKKVLNVEDAEIQEYEATLAYLSYLVGAEVAQIRTEHQLERERLAQLIFGGGERDLLEDIALGHSRHEKKKPIIMKVDSEQEAKLHQKVIESMAKGRYIEATNHMLQLQKIQGQKGKKKGKGSKSTQKKGPKK